jgi:hypothetical protein
MLRIIRVLEFSLLAFFLLCGAASAQETWGSVRGTVTDPSGAAVPGAQLELSGGALPRALTTNSDEAGAYRFAQVPAGTGYALSVTVAGFRTSKVAGINVELGKASGLDVKLEVGQVTESVIVSGATAMVDTQSSTSAVSVDRSFFDQLPKGRSFYDLIAIAPGARNEGKAGGYQVDGASGSENTYYLEGMEVTNIQTGVLDTMNRVPVEMVQQVQIKNGVMDAQYGGAMGGVVNAVLRSGSNEFHGEAGFYFNNSSMQARRRPTLEMDPTDATRTNYRYFQNTLDPYRTWNPIFRLGGPMIKNKVYFFSAYMPTQTTTDRTVQWATPQTITRTETQQYMANKLDVAVTDKLRVAGSWIYNPRKEKGVLPAQQGTDSPDVPWANRGAYYAGQVLAGSVDYVATNKLILSVRGGYNYYNYNNLYSPSTVTAVYSSANASIYPELPADLKRTSAGFVSGSGSDGNTQFNIFKRVNVNADASYVFDLGGQHNLKGGWQTNRLSNDTVALSYPNGYFRYYWNTAYRCVTSQCSGSNRGAYGYYRYYTYGTSGDASSNNSALFLQDSWRVTKRLTLNLGLRAEREFLPSFSKVGVEAAPPIEFGFGSKLSPRVGFAYDPTGAGKHRIYGSFGMTYDIMKYEMPRGSFGGDIYWTYFFPLDDPTRMRTNQGYRLDGGGKWMGAYPDKLYEAINWRIPSNDPNDSTVDPDLKPMKQRLFDIGYDFSVTPSLVASARYTNRRLIRTIEDVGTLGPEGEIYYIANPGFGLTADPKTWDAGFPVTPKAVREYDALELRLDKRFSARYQFSASYTYANQRGTYSGLASSDEPDVNGIGRRSPNVNRYFDLPWLGYNEQGTMATGPLATDRPHTFKLFGSYNLKSKIGTTTLAPHMSLYSGVPITTEINAISTTPVYPYDRGDLGRTPRFFNADFNVIQDFNPFKAHENMHMRFELSIFNLFNGSTVTNRDGVLIHPDDGQLQFDHDADIFKGFNTKSLMTAQDIRKNPTYGLANGFQSPRQLRLQVSFSF